MQFIYQRKVAVRCNQNKKEIHYRVEFKILSKSVNNMTI